jgi:hypothetical protein
VLFREEIEEALDARTQEYRRELEEISNKPAPVDENGRMDLDKFAYYKAALLSLHETDPQRYVQFMQKGKDILAKLPNQN